MALTDTQFEALANATLNRLADELESLDEEGEIEVELLGGILTIDMGPGRQFVINQHSASQQIWMSSPLSGGLHFSYDAQTKNWLLEDGRRLDTWLKAEVETLMGEA